MLKQHRLWRYVANGKRFQSSSNKAESINVTKNEGGQQQSKSEVQPATNRSNSSLANFANSFFAPSPFFSSMAQPWFERNDISRMFNHLLQANMSATRFPSVDVKETNDAITVIAEVPGMTRENIKVDYDEQMHALTISGEHQQKQETGGKNEKYHTIERHYGSFYRSIPIPQHIKQEQIKAEYKDGCLKIMLPKSESSIKAKSQIKIE